MIPALLVTVVATAGWREAAHGSRGLNERGPIVLPGLDDAAAGGVHRRGDRGACRTTWLRHTGSGAGHGAAGPRPTAASRAGTPATGAAPLATGHHNRRGHPALARNGPGARRPAATI